MWVAEGKHANYRSKSECDEGGQDVPPFGGTDTCDFNDTFQRFPITLVQQNIGTRGTPARDCTLPLSNSQKVDRIYAECLWSVPTGYEFNGWQTNVDKGSTAYGEHLRNYGKFGVLTEYGRTIGPVRSVTVMPSSLSMDAGSGYPFSAQMHDSTSAEVIGPTPAWSSSNPAVATVDQAGFVTAVAPGTALISAKYKLPIGSAAVTVY